MLARVEAAVVEKGGWGATRKATVEPDAGVPADGSRISDVCGER